MRTTSVRTTSARVPGSSCSLAHSEAIRSVSSMTR